MPTHTVPVLLVLLLVGAACSAGSSVGATAEPDDMQSHATSAERSAEPSPSASEDPLAACQGVEPEGEPLEIQVGTASYSFDPRMIEGPRHCQPFVVIFTNSDPLIAGSPAGSNRHNIAIRFENLIGALLFDGELIGQTTIRYEVPGLPAGEHYMYCKVHPDMTGTVLVGS